MPEVETSRPTEDPIRRMLEEAWDAGAVYGGDKAVGGDQPSADTKRKSDIDAIISARLTSGTISIDLSATGDTSIYSQELCAEQMRGDTVVANPGPDAVMAHSIRGMRND